MRLTFQSLKGVVQLRGSEEPLCIDSPHGKAGGMGDGGAVIVATGAVERLAAGSVVLRGRGHRPVARPRNVSSHCADHRADGRLRVERCGAGSGSILARSQWTSPRTD